MHFLILSCHDAVTEPHETTVSQKVKLHSMEPQSRLTESTKRKDFFFIHLFYLNRPPHTPNSGAMF